MLVRVSVRVESSADKSTTVSVSIPVESARSCRQMGGGRSEPSRVASGGGRMGEPFVTNEMVIRLD